MRVKLYQKLLSKKYLKLFFTIYLGLTIFFIGVDLITNLDKLPQSANLKILYITNMFLFFTTYTFTLSLVFAMISSIISHIKSNEFVVIYSLGASKKDIIKPYLYIITLFIIFYILLKNMTFFVTSQQVAKNILKYNQVSRYESNLFLKFRTTYIYISKLNKFKKEGQNIIILDTKKGDLTTIYKAKRGEFKDNFWILKDVNITIKPDLTDNIMSKKLKIKYLKELKMLYGFKPTIMDSLYQNSAGLTLSELIQAIYLLKDKGIKITSIKANLYEALFSPLFALFMAILVFSKLPIQQRGSNLALIASKLYFITLIVWGILFIITKMARNGVIPPEIGIIIPILLLGLYAIRIYNHKFDSF